MILNVCCGILALNSVVDTPSALISKMLSRYHNLNSLAGKIEFTQSLDGQTAGSISTVLQYDRPAKIYIKQSKSTGDKKAVTVISDGTRFCYSVPQGFGPTGEERLMDFVQKKAATGEKITYGLEDIYGFGAQSLLDRSTALDIAINRKEDLKFVLNQWASLKFIDSPEAKKQGCTAIAGDWRSYGNASISGTFEIWISKDSDIVRFERGENLVLGDGNTHVARSIWTVELKPNGKTDAALYKLK